MKLHKQTVKFLFLFFTFFIYKPSHALHPETSLGLPCPWIHKETKKTADLMAGLNAYRRKDFHKVSRRQKIKPAAGLEQKDLTPIIPDSAFAMPPVSKAFKKIQRIPAQTIGLNFTAATVADVLEPLVIPPNLNAWVGQTQVILMTYGIIRSFNKSTGQPDDVLNIDASSFFGVPSNDVRIDYDRFAQRWLLSCEGINPSGQVGTIVLAVSDGGTISQCSSWDIYTFSNAQVIPQISPLGTGDLDYQQLAVDKNAVYIAADAFNQSGYFVGTSTLVVQKSSLYAGNPHVTVFSGIFPGANNSLISEFTPPADNFDANPNFGYLINSTNNVYPSSAKYTKLYLYRISNPGGSNPALGSMVSITVPAYTNPANAPYKGNLFGSSAFLQTSFGKLNAPHVRNRQLYVCHNIQVDKTGAGNPSGDRVGVRWYQLDLTGDATGQGQGNESVNTVPALVQWGTLYDTATSNPQFYYIPSIMTDKNNNMVIACTVSGNQTYPNVAYTGRLTSDPKGTLRSPVFLTSSSYSYNFGPFANPSNGNIGQRWGDLSSLCPDPVNDTDLWTAQEFAAVQNGWGVQITQLTAQ